MNVIAHVRLAAKFATSCRKRVLVERMSARQRVCPRPPDTAGFHPGPYGCRRTTRATTRAMQAEPVSGHDK
jgi:hypothetical protein